MALSVTSVVLPYQLAGSDTTTIPTVQVNVLAGSQAQALSDARLLAETWLNMHHPGVGHTFNAARSKAIPDSAANGPFAYILSHRNHIQAMPFPGKVDDEAGTSMKNALTALHADSIYGVVLDLARLTYINSIGLTGIATNTQRLHMQLYNVPDAVKNVLKRIGLDRFLPIHPDLATALKSLVVDVLHGKK